MINKIIKIGLTKLEWDLLMAAAEDGIAHYPKSTMTSRVIDKIDKEIARQREYND